ncbi:MAG: AMP-binding protein, partial [Rhodoglobus sp.]
MFEPLADLDRHAAERPDQVALATPRQSYTFGQLQTASVAVSARLHEAGVRQGSVVAVDLPTAVEWIVDLALFRLAATSVSIRGVKDPGSLGPDVLITAPGRRAVASRLVVEVDELWLDHSVALAPDAPPVSDFAGDETIFRLILTSGTTGGAPKAAAYSVGALRHRSAGQHAHWTDARPELTLIGLSTTGGFHAAIACLRLGVPYLAVDGIDADALRLAATQNIEVLCGSPAQITSAIRVIADAGITFPALAEVRLAGAGPSAALLELIIATFGAPVQGVYGSTEGGGVSQLWLQPGGNRFEVGAALTGVELEIVDDLGMPLPTGTEGLVRYRTLGLVSGYLVDGIVEPFPDGWFVPGDLGTLSADGALVLGGRDSELFNLGGVK